METTKTRRPRLSDLHDREDWSALEHALWDACDTGNAAVGGDGLNLPDDCSDPDLRVRASFIAYLMWGGSEGAGGTRPHPKGVQIAGGWIDGSLDLEGCRASIDLTLAYCRLPDPVVLRDARIGGLYLPGCHLTEELNLQRLTTQRNMQMRMGFKAMALVDLGGSCIGGQLSCTGGSFLEEGRALNCQGAEISADVFLRGGFKAKGLVDFVRATVAGNLQVELEDEQVELEDGKAPPLISGIDLEGARIGGGFFWRGVVGDREVVDLTGANVGSLRDDWAAWEGVGTLKLDGFTYGRVEESMSVAKRLEWLGMGCNALARDVETSANFDPQPHVQLAKVLRAQGNRGGATRILVDREKRQRQAERARFWARAGWFTTPWAAVRWIWNWGIDRLFRVVFGYGHRPANALIAAFLLIISAGALNGIAYELHQFAPNDAVVLTSEEWQRAVEEAGREGYPLEVWRNSRAYQDYETFKWWLYGLDLVLPLDALGREEAWRASAGRGDWGWWAFYSRWVFQMAGIVIAAVGAAVLTGLVGRRD